MYLYILHGMHVRYACYVCYVCMHRIIHQGCPESLCGFDVGYTLSINFFSLYLNSISITARQSDRHVENQNTCSHKGVLKTRCFPNVSASPVVHRKTPPKLTSSPKIYDLHRTT